MAETDAAVIKTEVVETPQKREARTPLSIPVYRQTLSLSSLQAQRVMNRSFAAAAGSLFRIDVIIRILGKEEDVDEVESLIRKMIKELAHDMDKELSGADQLLADGGIETLPEYTHPREFEIEIKSPQIANFARLVTKLDQLMLRVDALWINGLMPNKQRARTTYQWQQRLLGLAGRVIGYEKRARIAAYRAGKQSEVEDLAPTRDQEADEKSLADEEKEIAESAA